MIQKTKMKYSCEPFETKWLSSITPKNEEVVNDYPEAKKITQRKIVSYTPHDAFSGSFPGVNNTCLPRLPIFIANNPEYHTVIWNSW